MELLPVRLVESTTLVNALFPAVASDTEHARGAAEKRRRK